MTTLKHTFGNAGHDVQLFMQLSGQEVPTAPSINKTSDLYMKLINEEMMEELTRAYDLLKDGIALGASPEELLPLYTEVADGVEDSIWVLIGLLKSMGLPHEESWAEVARSNMAKIQIVDGLMTVIKNEAGKVQKPEGWSKPNIVEVVRQAFIKAGINV
jgi:predicted HAD superfamily Cof-like phosphohydrolase